MKYELILRTVLSEPWAVLPEKMAVISELLALRAAGRDLTEAEVRARIGERPAPRAKSGGAVAVVSLVGVMHPRVNMLQDMSGGTSCEMCAWMMRGAMEDPNVSAIVLDVDSPGGAVSGVEELAAVVRETAQKKPVIAVANTMAASAAYWVASQASELVVSPSSEVGSIGVFMAHEDLSQALEAVGVKVTLVQAGRDKTLGNMFEPLSDEARAYIQERVDAPYAAFVAGVAKGRGKSAADVRAHFGQGRLVQARDAVRLGMADRVQTMDEVLERLGAPLRKKRMPSQDDMPPRMPDDTDGKGEAAPSVEQPADDLDLRERRLRLATR